MIRISHVYGASCQNIHCRCLDTPLCLPIRSAVSPAFCTWNLASHSSPTIPALAKNNIALLGDDHSIAPSRMLSESSATILPPAQSLGPGHASSLHTKLDA